MAIDPYADLAQILGCDVASLGPADVITALHPARRLRGLLDNYEASVANRVNELHEEGRSAPASDVLSRNAHVSDKEARRRGAARQGVGTHHSVR